MMKKTFYIIFLAVLQTTQMFAQNDSIHLLDEVLLSDVRLYSVSKANTVHTLKDSVLEKNPPVLTDVLKFNSPIYFRENGPGMVSSASFRGTSASQTAVIWNGININSSLNGQTDFNTLLTSGYEQIGIRSGGGSVLYGSGAIGGSVHLNNKFSFNQGFENKVRLQAGSFETFFGSYLTQYSTENTSLQFNLSHQRSENDFKYPNSDKFNENGDFENSGFSLSLAHILNEKNSIRFYSNYFRGNRGFSGTITAPSKSKYEDVNSRNLMEWRGFYGKFTSNLKLAYLDETYRYFENRQEEDHTYGRAKTGLVKYELDYQLSSGIKISGITDLNRTVGEGTNIGDARRNTGSIGLLFEHVLDHWSYEISSRKEFSDVYDSPLLFSFSTKYDITDQFSINLNVSRNYRIPSFNDLFWTTGGNEDLIPEESLQAEVGQEFRTKNFRLGVTAFVIEIDNLLRWVPGESGLWQPENTESVQNIGLETLFEWTRKWRNQQLNFFGTYAYTGSEDKKLDKTLIYVPRHKITAAISHNFKRLTGYYQFLYTGPVYTSSDNNYSLEGYALSNFGIEYAIHRNKKLAAGIEVRNLWDTDYQSMPSRPMPGRSIIAKLNFKF